MLGLPGVITVAPGPTGGGEGPDLLPPPPPFAAKATPRAAAPKPANMPIVFPEVPPAVPALVWEIVALAVWP